MNVPRIPLRHPLAPGEGLDSWLAGYSHAADVTLGELTTRAGIAPDVILNSPIRRAIEDTKLDFDTLAYVTGVNVADLQRAGAPLQRGVAVSRLMKGRRPVELLKHGPGSKFCPACLRHNDGRWDVTWRLGWVTTCTAHGCWLANVCPRCDRYPQSRGLRRGIRYHAPVKCCHTQPGHTGRNPPLCGFDLSSVGTAPAPAGVTELTARLAALTADDVTDAERITALALLDDWMTLTSVARLADLRGPGPRRAFRELLVETAGIVVSGDIEGLRSLARRETRSRACAIPTGASGGRTGLLGALARERLDLMSPAERLHWTVDLDPRAPQRSTHDVTELARRLPTLLWPAWAVRLMPPDLPMTDTLCRSVAMTALSMAGSTLEIEQARQLHEDPPVDCRGVGRALRMIGDHPAAPQVFAALCQLASHLAECPPPIDYRRRRELVNRDCLLTEQRWVQICRDAGVHPGAGRRLRYARLWIAESLTAGVPYLHGPDRHLSSPETYQHFLRTVPLPVVQALEDVMQDRLDGFGAGDEPVRWEPEAWTPASGWPGTEPVEVTAAVSDVLGSSALLGDIVRTLGISYDHAELLMVRFTTSDLKRDDLAWPREGTAPLTEAFLRDRIETKRQSLRSLAEELGCDRRTIADRCRELGVTVPGFGRQAQVVDLDELRRQYVDDGHTLVEIAAEMGMSPANLARVARDAGIPLRRRGGASHASAARKDMSLPSPLRDALVGQGAQMRVQRFQVVARCRSMNRAARVLGVDAVTVLSQVGLLERSMGGALVNRSSRRHEPQSLTALGEKLLAQADGHFGAPDVGEPAAEPLGSVLAGFRGEERLRRFLVVAGAATWADAADVLDTTPIVVIESMTRFEMLCGGALFAEKAGRGPVQLTDLGQKLQDQAGEYLAVNHAA